MSLKLANGENIVKQYDYAKTKKGLLSIQSRLIVTNKRVIEEKVCDAKRNERVVRSEIPIEKAKYVSTRFKREGNLLWLIIAIFGLILFIGGLISSSSSEDSSPALPLIGIVVLALGIGLFIFLRKSAVTCVISSDRLVVPAMTFSSATKRFLFKSHVAANNEVLKIDVDPAVALEMVDELGAVILDARCNVSENEEETV